MKYDVTIDPDDTANSHGLVVELVGTGKRVLDVGCATGYLAEALAQRGNQVSGVEVDLEAAEVARSRVACVITGDLETLDLVEQFGERSFDVLIFADVLEHLRNPLEVLRRARPLLDDDGFVVLSIPNVAHGAVRLALLEGRFEYRELGLLDDTHLRFFTRSTLEEFLHAAGFLATDLRRTKLDLFGTEIPLRPGDFDASVIEGLAGDPESTTYQFVVRAVPLGSSSSELALLNDLVAKSHEIERLRGELTAIARRLAATSGSPRLGLIVADPPSVVSRLRTEVMHAEMVRRLGGFDVRTYALSQFPEEGGATGEASHPLLPWTEERAVQIPTEVDAAVVLCSVGAAQTEPLQTILADLAGSGVPLHVVVTDPPGGGGDHRLSSASAPWWSRPSAATNGQTVLDEGQAFSVVVDPVALGGRLFGEPLLGRRLDYLRVVGKVPLAERFVVVSLVDEATAGWSAIDALGRRLDAVVVVIAEDLVGGRSGGEEPRPLRPPYSRVAAELLEPIDLLALLSGATAVITDSVSMLSLAAVLGTSAVGVTGSELEERTRWARSQGLSVTNAEGLMAAVEMSMDEAPESIAEHFTVATEVFLDDLADAMAATFGRRLAQSVPQRLDELADQVNVLEATNRGLRQVLSRERQALATRAGAYLRRSPDAPTQEPDPPSSRQDRRALAEAQEEIERLRFEIDAVYGTRVMRTAQPARRIYAKLRTLRR